MDVERNLNIPAELVVAIAYVESKLNPYAVNVQTNYRFDRYLKRVGVEYRRGRGKRARYLYSIYPRTLRQAKKLKVMFRYAKAYDVGVMQVSSVNFGFLKRLGIIKKVDDLFDPCTNVVAGATILKLCINRFGFTPEAVDCYHRGPSGTRRESAYVVRVGEVLIKLMDGTEE